MRLAGIATLLALAACQSPAPRPTYQDTRNERASVVVPAPRESAGSFDQVTDDAADRYLTEQIATAIEEEIRRRDAAERAAALERERAERQLRYAEAARDRAYAPRYYRRHPNGRFPWNTVVYGTLGGIIGHQSGRRDRGIAIGAGIGLLSDMLSWRW